MDGGVAEVRDSAARVPGPRAGDAAGWRRTSRLIAPDSIELADPNGFLSTQNKRRRNAASRPAGSGGDGSGVATGRVQCPRRGAEAGASARVYHRDDDARPVVQERSARTAQGRTGVLLL